MNRSILCLALGSAVIALSACQSMPRQYNGITGYQVESKTATSATLAYTLAQRANQELDKKKLQQACQEVLVKSQQYKLTLLSVTEIPNPKANASDPYAGVKLGSRTSIGLSDTPSLNNSEGYATRNALDTQPSTLKVVRYTCTAN